MIYITGSGLKNNGTLLTVGESYALSDDVEARFIATGKAIQLNSGQNQGNKTSAQIAAINAALAAGTNTFPAGSYLVNTDTKALYFINGSGATASFGTNATFSTDPSTGQATGLVDPVGGATALSFKTTLAFDVVVYGATPGGIAAAIAAKREGASVVVVEPLDWVGGMLTGGLSLTDVNPGHAKANVVGLAKEFFDEVAYEYLAQKQSFFRLSFNGEPKIYQKVVRKILQRNGIQIYTNSPLSSVSKTGTRITSALFESLGRITGKSFIDATYEGDLIAAAGCSFFIGREANATYGETNNGVRAIGVAAQFTDGVDPYVTPGVAGSGLLPGVTAEALGTAGAASSQVQCFNYRLCMTTNAPNKVAVPEPTSYNALNYELLAREIAISGSGWTAMADNFVTAALQGTAKFDINNKGPMSLNYVDPICTEYITATQARRAEIRETIKQYILGLLKFLQTDARVPVAMRTAVGTFGFCADEFSATGGFSPTLYVREGRRLVGDFVLKESDITSLNAFTDEVAYVYYTIDSHHVRRIVVGANTKNEGYTFVSPAVGAKVPLRVVMPKVAEVTNLAATFAVSASHVAFCSIRMEPIHMALGQAAGVVAALAARTGVNFQAVPVADVKKVQDIQGVQVGNGAILNTDATFTRGTITTNGSWSDGTSISGFLGGSYSATSAAGAYKRFAPNIGTPGQYRVFIKWPENQSNARSAAVPVTIIDATGTTSFVLNQNADGDTGDWFDAGVYTFAKGAPSAHYVQIATDGTNSTVISAVKFVPQ